MSAAPSWIRDLMIAQGLIDGSGQAAPAPVRRTAGNRGDRRNTPRGPGPGQVPGGYQGTPGQFVVGPDGRQYPINPTHIADQESLNALLPLLGNPEQVNLGFDNMFTSPNVPGVINPNTGEQESVGIMLDQLNHDPSLAIQSFLARGWTKEQLRPMIEAYGFDVNDFENAADTSGTNEVAGRDQSSSADQTLAGPQNPDTPYAGQSANNVSTWKGPSAKTMTPQQPFSFLSGAYPELPFATPYSQTPFAMAQSPQDTILPFQVAAQRPMSEQWAPGQSAKYQPSQPPPLDMGKTVEDMMAQLFQMGTGGGGGMDLSMLFNLFG